MVYPTLFISLREVRDSGLHLGGVVRKGDLLHQLIEDKPPMHFCPILLYLQALDLLNFMVVRCVQNWRTTRHLGMVLGEPGLGRP